MKGLLDGCAMFTGIFIENHYNNGYGWKRMLRLVNEEPSRLVNVRFPIERPRKTWNEVL